MLNSSPNTTPGSHGEVLIGSELKKRPEKFTPILSGLRKPGIFDKVSLPSSVKFVVPKDLSKFIPKQSTKTATPFDSLPFTPIPTKKVKAFQFKPKPIETSEEIKEVKLKPTQGANVERLVNILENNPYVIDNSIMGAGKTWMAIAVIAKIKPKHVIIIYDMGVTKSVWKALSEDHNLPVRKILSYDSLASRVITEDLLTPDIFSKYGYTDFGTCKHGLLYRGKDKNSNLFYSISHLMERYIREGLVIICDEFAKIKNKETANYKSVSSIVKLICNTYKVDNKSSSRVMFLSGCPFTSAKQKVSFMRMVSIIKEPKLYRTFKKKITLLGIKDVIDYCSVIDKRKTSSIIKGVKFEKNIIESTCAHLFDSIISVSYASAAPGMGSGAVNIHCNDSYYNISKERKGDLDYSLAYLNGLVKDGVDGHPPVVDRKGVAIAVPMIEYSKVEIFCRVAREKLLENRNCKVCIMVNYIPTIRLIEIYLKDLNPLIMRGSTSLPKREDILEKFNRHDNEFSLLVSMTSVICKGSSLHDTHGDFPRICLISPNYKVADMHQASFRFHRLGTMSDSFVHYVYGKSDSKESSILRTIRRASPQMKAAVHHQNELKEDIKFPGEHDTVYEDESKEPIPYLDYKVEGCLPERVHSTPGENVVGECIRTTKLELTGKEGASIKDIDLQQLKGFSSTKKPFKSVSIQGKIPSTAKSI
jgi:hypothetical protein